MSEIYTAFIQGVVIGLAYLTVTSPAWREASYLWRTSACCPSPNVTPLVLANINRLRGNMGVVVAI